MIGIIFAFLSSIVSGISSFLQKISLKKISNWEQALKSTKWLFSILLILFSFLFFITALKFERLIIIQPITYTSLFVIILLEAYVFKDKLKRYEIVAVILFFVGAIFVTNIPCNALGVFCE